MTVNEFLKTCVSHAKDCERFVSIQRLPETKKSWSVFCCDCGHRQTITDKYIESHLGIDDASKLYEGK